MDQKFIYASKGILLLLAAIFAISLEMTPTTGNQLFFRFPADTLKCSIVINAGFASREKRDVAFNYELLGMFGEKNDSYTKIEPPVDIEEGWNELIDGRRQIIVFNENDSIPDYVREEILISAPIEGNAVWAVSKENIRLINAINLQYRLFTNEAFFQQMSRRYFRSYSVNYLLKQESISSLSPYDEIIKKYSQKIGIDWRLLSSIIYQESKFSIAVASNKKAKGLMQIKESTAARYGVDDLLDPDNNVKAGSMHIERLIRNYRKSGVDSINSIKFALAAYHGGESRLEELRKHAAESGYDPNDWESMKDSFRTQNGITSRYISEILERYELYCRLID